MNKRVVNMNTEEAFAFSMYKAYMRYASIARDGTIFVPSPVCHPVSSPFLAILAIDKDENFIKIFSNNLYANLDICAQNAQRICKEYENWREE